MKTTQDKRPLNKTLAVLSGVVMSLSLATGSVLAVEVSDEDHAKLQALKQKEADKKLPAHKQPAPAGSKAANLAEAATNPIANLMQFQLQETYKWDNHNSSGYANVVTAQAVIPVPLPWESVPLLITRSTLPYVTTPNLGAPLDRTRGFGDAEPLLLAVPKLKPGAGYTVGVGINTAWPTAGDNEITGSGKYQAGPSALYLNEATPSWQWGMFFYQLWDYASASGRGGDNRQGVSKLSLQPVLVKHFKGGWYVGSPDTPQTYDFKANKWTWALGAQVGRVMKLGRQPVKLFGEILNNPENNAGPTSNWTAKFNITFLLPE